MDAWMHVNNTQYFGYLESARVKYFEAMGNFKDMHQAESGPMVAELNCKFRFGLTYPDQIQVGVRVKSVYKYGFYHEYCIVSESRNAVAAFGSCRLTHLNYRTGQIIPVDTEIMEMLQRVEGKQFQILDQ